MSKNTKVKIYFKADKDRHVTVELDSRKEVEKLSALVESEIFRAKYLADLDYSDKSGLVFKADGEKISAKTLLDALNRYLDGDETSSVKEDDEPKKDKDDKKKKKKKHKKDKDKKHKKHKKDKSISILSIDAEKDDPETDDKVVIMHRI